MSLHACNRFESNCFDPRFKRLINDIPSCINEITSHDVRNSEELAPWLYVKQWLGNCMKLWQVFVAYVGPIFNQEKINRISDTV